MWKKKEGYTADGVHSDAEEVITLHIQQLLQQYDLIRIQLSLACFDFRRFP